MLPFHVYAASLVVLTKVSSTTSYFVHKKDPASGQLARGPANKDNIHAPPAHLLRLASFGISLLPAQISYDMLMLIIKGATRFAGEA